MSQNVQYYEEILMYLVAWVVLCMVLTHIVAPIRNSRSSRSLTSFQEHLSQFRPSSLVQT